MNVLNFSHRIDRYQGNSQVYQETGKSSEHLNMLKCDHHRFQQMGTALQSSYSNDVRSILPVLLHHLEKIVFHGNEEKQIMFNKMHCTKIKISKPAAFPNTLYVRKHNSIYVPRLTKNDRQCPCALNFSSKPHFLMYQSWKGKIHFSVHFEEQKI